MDLLDQLRNLRTVDELNTLIESKGVDYLYTGFGLRNCPLFLAFLMTMPADNDQQFKKECIDTFFLHEVNLTLTHEEKDVGRIASVYGGDVRYYLYRRLAEKAYSHPKFLHNVLCLGMGSTYLNADILEILDLLLETNNTLMFQPPTTDKAYVTTLQSWSTVFMTQTGGRGRRLEPSGVYPNPHSRVRRPAAVGAGPCPRGSSTGRPYW